MNRADTRAQVLKNKRIASRTRPMVTTVTITPDLTHAEHYIITALGGALTVVNPIGNPRDADAISIRIKDDGTVRAITWGSEFRGSMFTATVVGKTHYAMFRRNTAETKWDCILNVTVP